MEREPIQWEFIPERQIKKGEFNFTLTQGNEGSFVLRMTGPEGQTMRVKVVDSEHALDVVEAITDPITR